MQLNDYLIKRCPYYLELLCVMQDSATARYQFTFETLGGDNDDNNEDENEDDSNDIMQEVIPEATTLMTL